MTDAIVIFGTNDQELYAGTQLLKLGYAPLVFVTSDKPKTAFFNFFKTCYNLICVIKQHFLIGHY